ncbi:hypothetical protein K435DRAFT_465005 [Dendrothele bispora CBS 962.96]|uniref:Uncharacterized protein n=1 Tax=Dendrothele bispora (strain CBS 962.96) TaxID=1314807 RepID=A0A4S8L127_DENBC|nr:hypothetical protein K435DRAFT_465005 [Dendrothele bispora CBS 962.96]
MGVNAVMTIWSLARPYYYFSNHLRLDLLMLGHLWRFVLTDVIPLSVAVEELWSLALGDSDTEFHCCRVNFPLFRSFDPIRGECCDNNLICEAPRRVGGIVYSKTGVMYYYDLYLEFRNIPKARFGALGSEVSERMATQQRRYDSICNSLRTIVYGQERLLRWSN